MIRIRSHLSFFVRKCRNLRPSYETIGDCRIRLAPGSHSLEYKRRFRRYDQALGIIAGIVHRKYPDLRAIDIGANVGDTAALIRSGARIPVLCVEGDRNLLSILSENVARLGSDIEIEASFVGPDGQTLDCNFIEDPGRNASIRNALTKQGDKRLRSLANILKDRPAFSDAKLLKTDTEGFDFDILRQSADYVLSAKPIIFFEYDSSLTPHEPTAGLSTIQYLTRAGYSDFIYFDNFGNYLLHAGSCAPGVFADLDHYLSSNRRHGVAVYYFDICAFHNDDQDLVVPLKTAIGVKSEPCNSH